MSWRVFAGALTLWIFVALLAGVISETYFGSNETSIVSLLMTPETPAYTNPVGGISATLSVSQAWMGAFFNAMFLNYPALFSGPFVIVRFLFLVVIMAVIILQVIQGVRPAS